MASLFERLKKFWQEMMEVEVEVHEQDDNREAKHVPIDEEQPIEFVSRQPRQTSSTRARTKNIYPRNHNEQELNEFMERTRPRFFRFPVVPDSEFEKQRKTKRRLTDIASDKIPSQYQRNQSQSEQGLWDSRESRNNTDYAFAQQERITSESEGRQRWKAGSLEQPVTDSYAQRGQKESDSRYSRHSSHATYQEEHMPSSTSGDSYNQSEPNSFKKPFAPTELFSPIYGKIKEGDNTVKKEQIRQARINEDGQIVIVTVDEPVREAEHEEHEKPEVDSLREQAAALAAQRLQAARQGKASELSVQEKVYRTELEAAEISKPEAVFEQAETEMSEAVKAEAVKQAESEVSEAVEPEILEQAEPEVSEAVEPETVEQAEPEVPEAVEPETVEQAESKVPEVVKPETVEQAESKVPEAVKPEAVFEQAEPEVSEAVKPEIPAYEQPDTPAVSSGLVYFEQQELKNIVSVQHETSGEVHAGDVMVKQEHVHNLSISDEKQTVEEKQPVLPIPFSYVAAKEDRITDEAHIDRAEQVQTVEEPKTTAISSVQPEAPVFPAAQPTESELVGEASLKISPNASQNHSEKLTSREDLPEERPMYQFPSTSLLTPTEALTEDDYEHTLEQRNLLEETLSNFNVNANIVNIVKGPSVTRFELQPAPGVKVNKITGLSDDIKLNLAAKDIRIEAPIPGRNAVGIEVPNNKSEPVFIRRILESEKFKNHPSPLAIALGMDIGGEPIVADIKKMPHGLVAGATGSGKSVCINSIIISLLFKSTPEQVRLLLIDPKMVELAPYNNLPHLVTPVVTDAKQATASLKWAVEEMEKRYALFVEAGVRDIERYNQTTDDELPYIVIIIDELADLMMVSPQDVEDCIIRIAQKARACGIHLLLATQRPSVDIITGNIKANVPTRLAFAVFSQIDSRTILDQSGAERLLGRGDMLFLESGAAPIRLQGNYVNDDEIDAVTSVIKKQRKPEYIFTREELEAQVSSIEMGDDPLFHEALVFVAEQGQASASSLQRRFRIGYNRAARLIEMMEASGYVAGQNGGKPRTVLITAEDAQALGEGSNLF
ncbi:FtsK/SpoIIIE domain-containing protein [Brevibacillus laterosporus]|uniref:DNA translocase FtsK n=1 Tax=Brevibacillus halotolerans TaxID=1507437 RepID=A0ABT4I082_9BACL|nr:MULTISPECIES: DNA translocase FtsK [Brevibacillus]MCR8986681.1 FtsK/SpoIIIE domain-containing protein [Brevibacillus laterosporus]MCZ0832417.1 DNA translocase FtsK [Brevibacillus halotolerans]